MACTSSFIQTGSRFQRRRTFLCHARRDNPRCRKFKPPPNACDNDFTPPVVLTVDPPQGAVVNNLIDGPRPVITATFSERVTGVQACNFRVERNVGGVVTPVTGAIAQVNTAGTAWSFTPLEDLCGGELGAITILVIIGIPPGDVVCPGIFDNCGNRLIPRTSSFTMECDA